MKKLSYQELIMLCYCNLNRIMLDCLVGIGIKHSDKQIPILDILRCEYGWVDFDKKTNLSTIYACWRKSFLEKTISMCLKLYQICHNREKGKYNETYNHKCWKSIRINFNQEQLIDPFLV